MPKSHNIATPAKEHCTISELIARPDVFIFEDKETGKAALFSRQAGPALAVRNLSGDELSTLIAGGDIAQIGSSDRGRRFKHRSFVPSDSEKSTKAPKTPRRAEKKATRRSSKSMQTTRYVQLEQDAEPVAITVNLGESPLGWLSKRRNQKGRPFLSDEQVSAGERLRGDFEHARMGVRVTQDWRRFLCAGVDESANSAAGPRMVQGSAESARKRVLEALEALGPELSDAVFRTCCFLEGLESIERDLDWSARSGKVVLRIALQRLASYYEAIDHPEYRKSPMFWQRGKLDAVQHND